MRMTLDLDDGLMRTAEQVAADRGTTVTHLVEESLRTTLPSSLRVKPYKYDPVVVTGTPVPGVDFTDRNYLYDVMDGFA